MSWFKKLNTKFKIAVSLISLFIGMLLFLTIKRKFTAKSKLNYELEQNTHEIELAHLEEDESLKEETLAQLRKEKERILRQIDILDEQEVELGREVSVDELEDFFKKEVFKMEYSISNLIKYASEEPLIQKRILNAILRYSSDSNDRELAANTLKEHILIDTVALESLVNPSDFKFSEPEIGKVEVESAK